MAAGIDRLTHLTVKSLLRPGKYPDGKRPDGLYFFVTDAGAKVWRLRYWFEKKEKQISLGAYPRVGITEARRLRDEAKLLLHRDIDPSKQRRTDAAIVGIQQHEAIAQRKALRAEAIAARKAQRDAFGLVAKSWYEKKRGGWRSDKHADQVWDSLERELKTLWDRSLDSITAGDVLDIITAIEKRPAPEVAKRTLQRASRVFAHGILQGLGKTNPAAGLSGALSSRPERHFARVTIQELPALLKAIEGYRGWQTRAGLKLLAYTFTRTSELRCAKWEEFDLDAGIWRIPASRMKAKREHLVPLASAAVTLLRELHALNGATGFVLPMESRLDRPASENVFLQALKKMGYGRRMTGHGFRGVAATQLREMGFPPEIVERQMAHAIDNKTERAYNAAEYLPQRRKMMEKWARYLDDLRGEAICPTCAGRRSARRAARAIVGR